MGTFMKIQKGYFLLSREQDKQEVSFLEQIEDWPFAFPL